MYSCEPLLTNNTAVLYKLPEVNYTIFLSSLQRTSTILALHLFLHLPFLLDTPLSIDSNNSLVGASFYEHQSELQDEENKEKAERLNLEYITENNHLNQNFQEENDNIMGNEKKMRHILTVNLHSIKHIFHMDFKSSINIMFVPLLFKLLFCILYSSDIQ